MYLRIMRNFIIYITLETALKVRFIPFTQQPILCVCVFSSQNLNKRHQIIYMEYNFEKGHIYQFAKCVAQHTHYVHMNKSCGKL